MSCIFINSIPKSGTYRVASMLQQCGLHVTGLHITETQVWDYASTDIDTARKNPDHALLPERSPAWALRETAKTDAQVLVGHFGFSISNARLLEPYTSILLVRDLREVIVSWCRWQAFTGRSPTLAAIEDPAEMVATLMRNSSMHVARIILSLLPWYFYLPAAQVLRNETLREPETIRQLLRVCGLAADSDQVAAVLQQVSQNNTLTRVPGRSELAACWSASSERHFREHRLHEVNAVLGYPRDWND